MPLTMKENDRLKVMQEVLAKERTVERAAELLGLSERHVYRVLARVRAGGALGVIHGNRGKEPRNKLNGIGLMSRNEKRFFQLQHSIEDETISQCIHSTPYQPQGKGKVNACFGLYRVAW